MLEPCALLSLLAAADWAAVSVLVMRMVRWGESRSTSGVFAGALRAFDDVGKFRYDAPVSCLWAGDGCRDGEGGEEGCDED